MTTSRLIGLTALGLALATRVAAGPTNDATTAEELFRRFEKQVREGKSLFIAYVGERATKNGPETTRRHYGGTYYARPGTELVMRWFNQGDPDAHDWFVAPTEHYYGPVTRQGFFDNLNSRLYIDIFMMHTADFKFVDPRAGVDPPGSRAIAYTLYLRPAENPPAPPRQVTPGDQANRGISVRVEIPPAPPRQVTLWLDEKSLAPLKRSVRWSSDGQEFEVTERYCGFSTAEIPEPFRREAVPAFVLDGKLSAKIGVAWVALPWMVEGILYRVDEDTRLLFGERATVTLAPRTEFTLKKDILLRKELHLARGLLSAELGPADALLLVLGPARLASGAGPPERRAVVTAAPDRVVVERGMVEYEGVAAKPSSEVQPYSLSGHLLQEGLEYRLADAKLEGQKERSLPGPDRLK
jgi:hypothetical protein